MLRTPDRLRAILLHELAEYAKYIQWHVERNAMYAARGDSLMPLQPFDWSERINPAILRTQSQEVR